MKKLKMINRATTVALLFFAFAANAQKLPNIQPTSLRAPANLKVDGKTTEWDNQFQAHNHATDIFYTLSNDDSYLYLTVQATDPDVITKIIVGGLTFTIQKSGKKDDKGGINITYPVFDKKTRPSFNLKYLHERGKDQAAIRYKDSMILVYNATLRDRSKMIKVTGIPGLDTLISVYNEDGVKTADLFDKNLNYTYELAVDLNQLGFSINDPAKFAYNISTGTSIANSMARMMNLEVDASGTLKRNSFADNSNTVIGATSASISSLTDFWGEYTLAIKK